MTNDELSARMRATFPPQTIEEELLCQFTERIFAAACAVSAGTDRISELTTSIMLAELCLSMHKDLAAYWNVRIQIAKSTQ